MTTETDPARWIDVLAGSHDRICDLVGELDDAGLQGPSYCTGWSIAQVLSHLGSGAEIFKLLLDAVVAGEPTPSREVMPAIWDRWNGMRPQDQAEEFLATDGQLVETLENLGDRLDDLTFTFFGAMQLDAAGLVGMRLSEHAVHTWDVAVALDPKATVDPDAVGLLVDRLPQMAGRAGRPEAAAGGLVEVTVATVDPVRRFVLRVDEVVRLDAGESPGTDAREPAEGARRIVHLPSEAFLRLVYGRLDPAHTPAIAPAEEPVVESLRTLFPGF